jgi:RNA polymerase primary sigma factor
MTPSKRDPGNISGIPDFLSRALKHPILTKEEERTLIRRTRRGPMRSRAKATETLVAYNLRFLIQQARKNSWLGQELDDAFQEAALALFEDGIPRFKLSAGTRLSTYASWWIRHAVSRFGQDHARTVRVPVNTQEKGRKLAKAIRAFVAEHGREPTDEELAARVGMTIEDMDRVRIALAEAVSIDAERPGSEDQRTLQDLIADPDDSLEGVTDAMDRETACARLASAMAALLPIERAVLESRFRHDRTLVETADHVSGMSRGGRALSRERIRQLEARALDKLRRELADLSPL